MKNSTIKPTIKYFLRHAFSYPQYIIPLLITIPITIVVGNFVEPYITSQVLNMVSQNTYDPNDLMGSFGGYIFAFAIAAVISGVIGWRINVWLIWMLELKVVKNIAQETFEHLMKMSPNFHVNRFAGSLVSQSSKLWGSYIRFADSTIFNLYALIISIIAAVAILAPRVPMYALTLVAFSVAYVIGTFFLSKAVAKANAAEAEAQNKQTGYLADSLSNVMAIKSFTAEQREFDRYQTATDSTRNAGIKSMYATTKREIFGGIVTSLVAISALLIAVIGVGVFKADVATIFLMVSYTSVIGIRLWDFQSVMRQYNRAFGDASDMIKTLAIEPEIKDPSKPERPRINNGQVTFKDVVFTHADADDSLFKDLNLTIKSGEKIGLVGHSGSGKTTLTKLLLRFADIDSGQILIDGQDITNITQTDLRSNIAYVPQEPLLFHRSIKENIAYGKPNATEDEVKQAAKKANASEFIENLPQGYETLVGERGVKLSGGQRQRIAIARAILKDAPILVLDEATSALDSESEVLIQKALWELMKDRTAIVIAHRLSTVQKMDQIVVLENGKIIEQGNHSNLLQKQGEYAKLWAHQSGGFIEE
ncbi:MAG: ABC transporter ATP-binding protein [Candidatus Woesebacteria bacterium]|jgi:ATP-binding cassette subfamily B protein